MTAMTAQQLATKIAKLSAKPPATSRYERELAARGIWSAEGAWYESQKEHWLGWLSEYDGPGAYSRKTWKGRSAEFVYNHIGCPPMLMWLAEAIGVPKKKLEAAKGLAFAGRESRASHCAKLRAAIPWHEIEATLRGNGAFKGPKKSTKVLQLNLHREFFAAIAAETKRIEYRRQSPHWRKRLEGREYDTIQFRNGYLPNAPEMLVEFRRLRRYGKGRSAYYAISLGRILKMKHWRN